MIWQSRRRGRPAPSGVFMWVIIGIGVLLSVFSFWFSFHTQPLRRSDLTEIDGSLQKTAMQRGRGASYFLWLKGYSCSFNISSIDIREDQWRDFVSGTTGQTSIRLLIHKSDAAKLSRDASVDIVTLFTGSKTVLSLERYNEAALSNARLALILGFVFSALTAFLIGLSVIMFI